MPTRADCWASATFVSCFASLFEESRRAYRPSMIASITTTATRVSTSVSPDSPGRRASRNGRRRLLIRAGIAEPHVDGLGRLPQPREGTARRTDDNGQELDAEGS